MKIVMLAVFLISGLAACGSLPEKSERPNPVMTAQQKPTTQCKIQYHDVPAGKSGETDYMPKEEAVERIKMIKSLPGFAKLDTDQWLSCK